MNDEVATKSRCRREALARANSTSNASCSSLNSTDTMSSTGSRVRSRRAHLHRAASNRKIGRTISNSSFLQHKRVKLQRRVQRTISGAKEDARNQQGSSGEGTSSSSRNLPSRSQHNGSTTKGKPSDRNQPTASLAPKTRRGFHRAFSSDELLSRLANDENLLELMNNKESRSSRELKAKESTRKATLAPSTSSLIGAVASNYEKALAKVSHLFLSTEDASSSDAKKSEGKKSSKSKNRNTPGRIATVSNNYDEALAKAVERFKVQ